MIVLIIGGMKAVKIFSLSLTHKDETVKPSHWHWHYVIADKKQYLHCVPKKISYFAWLRRYKVGNFFWDTVYISYGHCLILDIAVPLIVNGDIFQLVQKQALQSSCELLKLGTL